MDRFFVGIDIGKSRSAVAVLGSSGQLCKPEPFYCNTPELHDRIMRMAKDKTLLVGIDAPLTLPAQGNCRGCDRKLLKQRISIYPAGADFFKEISLIGIELKNRLAQKGLQVVEIYPYASRVRLRIGLGTKKRTPQGRRLIQDELIEFIPNLPALPILKPDILDAILGAYTVYLHDRGQTEIIDGEGEIIVPIEPDLSDHRLIS